LPILQLSDFQPDKKLLIFADFRAETGKNED